MTTEIKNLISQYENKGDFTYSPISDEQLDAAQSLLNVILPIQYVDFLREYGHGGVGGVEVIGVGKDGTLLFVDKTLKFRGYGMPLNLVVIENCDEWIYCINSFDGSIVSWSVDEIEEEYSDFDSYLLDRFMDAAENL